jgi:hypothetical protein
MKEFFEKCKPVFEANKSKKHVEIEIRLGKMNGKIFDTNVGKDIFSKVLKALKKYQQWESVNECVSTVYYKGNTRMVIDENTEQVEYVQKERVKVVDYKLSNKPLDVRFAVSTEKPTVQSSEDEVMDHVRHKQRISFVRKNLVIDMTEVTGDPDDMDDESEASYEIELEIINPKDVSDDDTLYNIIYKVECVMKTIC